MLDWYLHEYLTSEGMHKNWFNCDLCKCVLLIHWVVLVYAWLSLCVSLCTIYCMFMCNYKPMAIFWLDSIGIDVG